MGTKKTRKYIYWCEVEEVSDLGTIKTGYGGATRSKYGLKGAEKNVRREMKRLEKYYDCVKNNIVSIKIWKDKGLATYNTEENVLLHIQRSQPTPSCTHGFTSMSICPLCVSAAMGFVEFEGEDGDER